MPSYAEFLDRRTQLGTFDGFDPSYMPDYLFAFQVELVEWAVRKGRAAIFADCGLGKTPMQLVWAENVHRHTGKPILIVTPLAVTFQTEHEADKFQIEAHISRNGKPAGPITITNYDRLHLFDQDDYAGMVCDESSAIKSFDSERKALVTDMMRKMRYRLLATATAAPNDFIELGTSSEALGYLGYMDMLNRFFTNSQNTSHPNRRWAGAGGWRFKGHAEDPFWRWVASWARALRAPSDLGHPDNGFILPDLHYRRHIIDAKEPAPGRLFDMPAVGLQEQKKEARRTVGERCEQAAQLLAKTDVGIAWCELNVEGDLLTSLIPGAVRTLSVVPPRLLRRRAGMLRRLRFSPPMHLLWDRHSRRRRHAVEQPETLWRSGLRPRVLGRSEHPLARPTMTVRRCYLCDGTGALVIVSGAQTGNSEGCPRCADMPWLPWKYVPLSQWNRAEQEAFKPDPETVVYWCFTHDAPWYDYEGLCYRAMAEGYHQGFKVLSGVEFNEAIGTCDECGWLERTTPLDVAEL